MFISDRLKAISAKRKSNQSRLGYVGVLSIILLFIVVSLAHLSPYRPAGSGQTQYYRARVLSVHNQNDRFGGRDEKMQVRLMDGPAKGDGITVLRNITLGDSSYRRLPVGSEVLLTRQLGNGSQYSYLDRWRVPGVATLFLILLSLVVIVGWWRGITSVLGLFISIGVLAGYVVPRIVDGQSAYTTCVQAAFIITAVSVYAAHGFSKRTTIAFISSLASLLVIIGLVALATYLAGTSEVINDETYSILYSPHSVNLAGLLTGGIIIASLGVIYDITTGQAAAVDEIYKAHKKQSTRVLYKGGLSVGREHIAALINTLALVYVGIAFPSIVITALYNHVPLIVATNDELIIEEVVRTFVATAGVLLAVPLTTWLAAYILPKWYGSKGKRFDRFMKETINF
ncbi:MAG TPA: YibE/F family protein [Candidatus Binatia bacterium]|nr:YibE/F family protein [Candidatus Binatia bacterium]